MPGNDEEVIEIEEPQNIKSLTPKNDSNSDIYIKDPKTIRRLEKCIEEHYEKYLIYTYEKLVTKKAFPKRYGGVLSIDCSLTGTYIVTSNTTGIIQFRNHEDVLRQISAVPGGEPATCVRFHPTIDDLAMVAEEKGRVLCMRVQPSELHPDHVFVKEVYDVDSIEFSRDGNSLAVGGRSRRIRVYDVETRRISSVFSVESNIFPPPQDPERFHLSKVCSLSWSQLEPNILVSGSWDNTIRVWDIRVPEGSVMSMQGPNICGDCVDVHGNRVLVGAWEVTNALTIWDLTSGSKLRHVKILDRILDTGEDFLFSAKFWRSDFNSNGRYALIGGSGTKKVEVVDVITDRLMCCWSEPKTVTSITSMGSVVAWGGDASAVSVAEFRSPAEFLRPDSVEEVEEEEESEEFI